ncbi:hypothetical protein BJX70DRAFT_75840 [Aspergillus crustosus]
MGTIVYILALLYSVLRAQFSRPPYHPTKGDSRIGAWGLEERKLEKKINMQIEQRIHRVSCPVRWSIEKKRKYYVRSRTSRGKDSRRASETPASGYLQH